MIYYVLGVRLLLETGQLIDHCVCFAFVLIVKEKYWRTHFSFVCPDIRTEKHSFRMSKQRRNLDFPELVGHGISMMINVKRELSRTNNT